MSDIDHLTNLLAEARRVYEAAEKAGVRVELGHYRRLSAGVEAVQSLRARLEKSPDANVSKGAPE